MYIYIYIYPKRSKAAYPPPRGPMPKSIEISLFTRTLNDLKIDQTPIQMLSKIYQKSTKKSIKNRWKIDPKSMKNRSKIEEKSMENRWKINQNRYWAPSGSRGRLWEPFGRVLGASWRDLGAVLAPKMAPKCSQNLSKIDAKIDEFFDAFWDRILIDFPSQVTPQNPEKSIKNRYREAIRFWPQILIDFWWIFGSNFVPWKHEKYWNFTSFPVYF